MSEIEKSVSSDYEHTPTKTTQEEGSSLSQETLTQGPRVLTQEQKSRIVNNRELARQRLKKRAETFQDDSSLGKGTGNFGGFSLLEQSKAKRAKIGKESEYMTELKNVCNDGSVVRIQGTKLIDTGGGFLIEERDLIEQEETPKVLTVQPPAFLPTDSPNCEECGSEFSESYLLNSFNHSVCDTCKDIDDKHNLITKTDARNQYLLKDVDLDKREPVLKFISRPNPHNNRWGDMKLYLRVQVEKRAIEVWGSLEKIEEQLDVREETRVKSKIKKYNKKMESLRMSARSSLYTRDLGPHEHTWGPEECIDEDEDLYKHKCTDCDQEETFEKM